jgi:hypothetical protein
VFVQRGGMDAWTGRTPSLHGLLIESRNRIILN